MLRAAGGTGTESGRDPARSPEPGAAAGRPAGCAGCTGAGRTSVGAGCSGGPLPWGAGLKTRGSRRRLTDPENVARFPRSLHRPSDGGEHLEEWLSPVEGTRLEIERGVKPTVGSNPTSSASFLLYVLGKETFTQVAAAAPWPG